MARRKATGTTEQKDSAKVQGQEVEAKTETSIYVNDQAKEYFEKSVLAKFKVHVTKALYKRVPLREGSKVPTCYIVNSAKVNPPKTQEYEYQVICAGGNSAKDVVSGPDAQNLRAEKEKFLKLVNDHFNG